MSVILLWVGWYGILFYFNDTEAQMLASIPIQESRCCCQGVYIRVRMSSCWSTSPYIWSHLNDWLWPNAHSQHIVCIIFITSSQQHIFVVKFVVQLICVEWWPGARLTKAYDVTIQRYRNSHAKIQDSKMHILWCMGSQFCVKFQRCPLKFHTKFWTHTLQNMHFMRW